MKCFLLFLVGIQLSAGLIKSPEKFYKNRLHALKSDNPLKQAKEASGSGILYVYKTPGVGLTIQDFYSGVFDQQFKVNLDFTTSTTWLPSTDCKTKCEEFCSIESLCQSLCRSDCCTPPSKNPNFACDNKQKVNTTSSTFTVSRPGKTWQIEQGEQRIINGTYGKNEFRLLFATAKNSEFGVATELSLSLAQWNADGVLGLGKKQNNGDDTPSIIGNLDKPLFQIAPIYCDVAGEGDCGGISFSKEELSDGVICKKDNAISFKTNTNDWGFQINEYTLGDKTLKETLQVALDFESNFVTLNDKLFEQLTNLTQPKYDPDSQLYKVDCSMTFEWKITANGKNYLIIDQTLLISDPAGDDKSCYLKFQPKYKFDKSNVDIVFGLPILVQYCETFKIDDETVSFYESA